MKNGHGQQVTLTQRALPEAVPEWGVLILESHHAHDFEMEWRSHSFYKFIYVLSGSGRIGIRSEEYRFATRNVVVIPPRHKNRIIDDPGSPASLFILCVATHLLRLDPKFPELLGPGTFRLPRPVAEQVERQLRRLTYVQDQRTELTPLSTIAHALDLVAKVASQSALLQTPAPPDDVTPVQRDIDEYISYLNANFFEASDIDAAAKMLGVSRRTFTDAFRKATGTTWLEYVSSLRVKHACHLLETTGIPIATIAFECGFEDVSTFYRRFMKITEMSPGRFRAESEPANIG